MNIFGRTTRLMQQVLDLRTAQHQATIFNIANEEALGYRANERRFTEALAAARRSQPMMLQAPHSHHLSVPGAGIRVISARFPPEIFL